MRKTSTFLLKRKNSFIFLIASILLLCNCRKDNLSTVNPSAFNKEKIIARFFEMPVSISDDIKDLARDLKKQDSLYNFLPEFSAKNGYPNWSNVIFSMENSQENQLKSLSNQTNENASNKGFFLIPFTDEITSKVKSYIFAKKHGKDTYSYSLYNRQSLSEVKVTDSLKSELLVTQAIFGYFEKSINETEEIEITNPQQMKLKNVTISFGESNLQAQSSSKLKPNYYVCNLVETVKISFQTTYLTTGDFYTETIFTSSMSTVCGESNEEGGGGNTGWWNYLTGYIGDNPSGNSDPFYPWWLPGGIGDGIPWQEPIASQQFVINKLRITDVRKIQFIHSRGDISDSFVLYLEQNGNNTENIEFLKWAFEYLFSNQNLNFDVLLSKLSLANLDLNDPLLLNKLLRVDLETRVNYPKFSHLVDNMDKTVIANPQVLDALIQFSGLTRNQILTDLKPGQGPLVKLKDLTNKGAFGSFYPPDSETTLNIDLGDVNYFEQKLPPNYISDLNYSDQRSQALGYVLALVTLHEYVHYGRHTANLPLEGDVEFGVQFEKAAVGFKAEYTNMNDLKLVFKIIW